MRLRRLFQFRLRTLLVLVTLVGLLFAWQLNWLRQRRAFLARANVTDYSPGYGANAARPSAPGLLRLFGEPGVRTLVVVEYGTPDLSADMETAERLFPEPEVISAAFISGAIYSR
jgi:hypothetical protein